MFMGFVQRKRQQLRRRLPGSPPQRLGEAAAIFVAHIMVWGSYGAAYAIAYLKEVPNADREGAYPQEPGRGTKEIGTGRG